MVLYITIDVYTAIMKTIPIDCLRGSVGRAREYIPHNEKIYIDCLRGSVGRAREYRTVIFKRCVLSSNPVRDIYYCKETVLFLFFIKFSPFCNIVSPFCLI